MARIAFLAKQPEARAWRPRRPRGGHRRRRRLRRQLLRFVGEPEQQLRRRHADDRQRQGERGDPDRRRNLKPGGTRRHRRRRHPERRLDRRHVHALAQRRDQQRRRQPDVGEAQPRRQGLRRVARRRAPSSPAATATTPTIYGSPTATIAGMSSPVALGTFAAQEKHRYEFSVQLDASATDAYQGDTSSVQFDWNARPVRSTQTASGPSMSRPDPARRAAHVAARSGSSPSSSLAGALLALPLAGYHRYVITGGSMGGTIERGSVVWAKAVPVADLRVGDVITYEPPRGAGPRGPRDPPDRRHRPRPRRPPRVPHQGRRQRAASTPGPSTSTTRTQARVAFHVPHVGYALADGVRPHRSARSSSALLALLIVVAHPRAACGATPGERRRTSAA